MGRGPDRKGGNIESGFCSVGRHPDGLFDRWIGKQSVGRAKKVLIVQVGQKGWDSSNSLLVLITVNLPILTMTIHSHAVSRTAVEH